MSARSSRNNFDFALLIVGGGMAAGRLVKELRSQGFADSVAVVCAEPYMGYNRVLLPDYLAGACSLEEMHAGVHQAATVFLRTTVQSLQPAQRRVVFADGRSCSYRRLVLATGSLVPAPALAAAQPDTVSQLRNLHDVQRIQQQLHGAASAVVIGGGLLGLEAADALARLGLRVRIVHRGARLMTRQIDDLASSLLVAGLGECNIRVSLNATVAAAHTEHGRQQVILSTGETCDADLIITATGAQPNDQLARAAGLACDQGVQTNLFLQTNVPDVYAMGECACVDGQRQQLVAQLNQQAAALAATLGGAPTPVAKNPVSTRLKMQRIALFAAGEIQSQRQPGVQNISLLDPVAGVYRLLQFDQQRLLGAVLLGDTRASREIVQRIDTELSTSEQEQLAFGLAA
ncbi:MAG: FAD-dependent oxidoreductase [Pseudomonadota bacterium]